MESQIKKEKLEIHILLTHPFVIFNSGLDVSCSNVPMTEKDV